MEKLLRCDHLGTNCDFQACGESVEEAEKNLLAHARAVHGLKDIPKKDLARAKENMQDAFCVPKGGYYPGRG